MIQSDSDGHPKILTSLSLFSLVPGLEGILLLGEAGGRLSTNAHSRRGLRSRGCRGPLARPVAGLTVDEDGLHRAARVLRVGARFAVDIEAERVDDNDGEVGR